MSEIGEAPIDRVISRVKSVYRSWSRTTTVDQMRRDWDELFAAGSLVATVESVSAGGVQAEWVYVPGTRADMVVLYFHGGGFQVGSTRSHRELMAHVSGAAACQVLGINYRLAPEHRFPAALHDALSAYDWLLAQGFQAANIALAGDSAGAGLALSTLLKLRDARRALPAAAVLMSAWTDLTASGTSYESRAKVDPIHQRPMVLAMARSYLGPEGDAHDSLASPLFADLQGLPPLLIQVGDRETVLSDSTLFAEKARTAGVSVTLEVWENMIHVFQQFPAELSEAREALKSIGDFLKAHFLQQSTTKGPKSCTE
jgi:epsilon-lactone hydrolase